MRFHHYHFHILPLWFLVLSLFLPRLALFLTWLGGWVFGFIPLVNLVLWALVPRVLVLILIAGTMGLGLWFWLHLLVALMVWGGSSTAVSRR
jgi:hypothetical protein